MQAPWVGKIPWRRAWQPTPVFLPGESHGQRNLAGYSPWSHKESDTTERLSTAQHMLWGKIKADFELHLLIYISLYLAAPWRKLLLFFSPTLSSANHHLCSK